MVSKESLRRYALNMQELAEDAPITEAELVEYMVDGLQDKSMTSLVCLSATIVADFKKLVPKS